MPAASSIIAFLAASSFGLFALAWLLVVSWRTWHTLRPRAAGVGRGVSVIKPLCGADDDLERNLVSFFRLDHEPLQLVFGVADPGDPALAVVRRIARRHPQRDVTIVAGANHDAPNPKVGLQERLLPHARHDVILLSDSNVRVAPDEIGRVLPAFDDPRVGLAYQAVTGIGEESLPAALENLHYNELAGVLAIGATLLTRQHAVNGKGEWVRREALAAAGGIEAVRDNAADDSALARLVAAAGWKVRLSPVPVRIVHRTWSWGGSGSGMSGTQPVGSGSRRPPIRSNCCSTPCPGPRPCLPPPGRPSPRRSCWPASCSRRRRPGCCGASGRRSAMPRRSRSKTPSIWPAGSPRSPSAMSTGGDADTVSPARPG